MLRSWAVGIKSTANSVSLAVECLTLATNTSGNEKTVDRKVYLDSPLSVQVVTPKQHDHELFRAMEIIDRAVQVQHVQKTSSKL